MITPAEGETTMEEKGDNSGECMEPPNDLEVDINELAASLDQILEVKFAEFLRDLNKLRNKTIEFVRDSNIPKKCPNDYQTLRQRHSAECDQIRNDTVRSLEETTRYLFQETVREILQRLRQTFDRAVDVEYLKARHDVRRLRKTHEKKLATCRFANRIDLEQSVSLDKAVMEECRHRMQVRHSEEVERLEESVRRCSDELERSDAARKVIQRQLEDALGRVAEFEKRSNELREALESSKRANDEKKSVITLLGGELSEYEKREERAKADVSKLKGLLKRSEQKISKKTTKEEQHKQTIQKLQTVLEEKSERLELYENENDRREETLPQQQQRQRDRDDVNLSDGMMQKRKRSWLRKHQCNDTGTRTDKDPFRKPSLSVIDCNSIANANETTSKDDRIRELETTLRRKNDELAAVSATLKSFRKHKEACQKILTSKNIGLILAADRRRLDRSLSFGELMKGYSMLATDKDDDDGDEAIDNHAARNERRRPRTAQAIPSYGELPPTRPLWIPQPEAKDSNTFRTSGGGRAAPESLCTSSSLFFTRPISQLSNNDKQRMAVKDRPGRGIESILRQRARQN